MTIVSTASSGGGLKDYGIFRNETVFTVYIPMTHSSSPAPSWVLQYSVLRNSTTDPRTLNLGGTTADQLVPPFPLNKENPSLPEDAVAKNAGRTVVVYLVIDVEGKPGNLRMIYSPNPLLTKPILEALGKWTFRPAEAAGHPTAVKALIGIPLNP
jgi:outer membrane biosynthesis protein TonB